MRTTPTPSEDYFLAMPSGPPTQGDVWSHLPLIYHHLPCPLSLVITPSCDFAHNKAQLVNYVELVPFDEYMQTAGARQLLEDEFARSKETLKNGLNQANCSALLEIGVDPVRVLEELSGGRLPESKIQPKRLAELEALVVKMRRTRMLALEAQIQRPEFSDLVSDKLYHQFEERIIRNQVSDLHFLPSATASSQPSIVLLRSVSACSYEFLQRAHACRTDAEWSAGVDLVDHQIPELRRSSRRPERVARLRSPYLHALIARLGALFARVGVPDLPASYITALIASE